MPLTPVVYLHELKLSVRQILRVKSKHSIYNKISSWNRSAKRKGKLDARIQEFKLIHNVESLLHLPQVTRFKPETVLEIAKSLRASGGFAPWTLNRALPWTHWGAYSAPRPPAAFYTPSACGQAFGQTFALSYVFTDHKKFPYLQHWYLR